MPVFPLREAFAVVNVVWDVDVWQQPCVGRENSCRLHSGGLRLVCRVYGVEVTKCCQYAISNAGPMFLIDRRSHGEKLS